MIPDVVVVMIVVAFGTYIDNRILRKDRVEYG